ncbi:gastrula zinc finger protein XlCGF57.1-like [Spea bombifrons]|uniref:gastrula zinc finger protein XlCGF57.1-like n=1 Tax=Spea bombifrons TaxID=233779 RepID=UPI0023493D0E|nr:gastrula zinc finger protein XlCGF57.1-like [Spea bombifrons]
MDKDPVAEKILRLTLEIISLLSGEDYMIVRKPSDCVPPSNGPRVSDGPPGTRSPSPVPPPHSLTHERNREQKILELTNKMMSLLTGEVSAAGNGTLYSNTEACVWMVTAHCVSQVPVRCDDVTVYFSMEEWEYLEGHKELYRDVMMETHQPRGSPGKRFNPCDASEVRDRVPNSPLDCKTSHFIKEESASCEETDICDPAESPQTELTSTRNEDGSPSDEDGNVSAPDTHTEHDGGDNTSVHVKEESASNEDYWIPTEHKGSTSTDKTQTSNTHFQCETPPDEGTYSCPECQERFTSDSDLLLHQTIHDRSAASSLGCEKSSNSECIRHRRIHRARKSYSCSECGKCFTSNSNLVKHLRIHTGEKPFSCSECGRCFARNWNLDQHLRLHTGEKLYSCSECGKCFARSSDFVFHQQAHAGEKTFLCSECGEHFSSNSNLVQHLRIHSEEKPFSCSECGKSFKSNANLVRHLRIHTGEKPFSCSDCGKSFNQKIHFVRHQRIHTGEKPFPCSKCGKCFTSSTGLVEHLRIHTGEKPYSCSECGKCFAHSSGFAVHQRSHTGEKPYPCSVCGKSFTSNWNLVQHVRVHTEEEPFSCSECGKCFKQYSNLTYHQRIHSGGQNILISLEMCGEQLLDPR